MSFNDNLISNIPRTYQHLVDKAIEIGFDMSSDLLLGSLLKTLVSSKPRSNILELGTGISLSLSWMIAGLDDNSKITTIDKDQQLVNIARDFFESDPRVNIICEDASQWIQRYSGAAFDLIFADAWPGKYSLLNEVLELLTTGGFYVIDDMSAQPNWPPGHETHVHRLIHDLDERDDLTLTKLNWSSGIIIATKL